MSWPRGEWIAQAVVLAIHDEQIAEHGGVAGIRDLALLESAPARPRQLEAYGDPPPDLAALAAAYAVALAKNYAFNDGNKRTSWVVTHTFLVLNGSDISVDDVARVELWVSLGEGTISEEDVAEWLRSRLVKL